MIFPTISAPVIPPPSWLAKLSSTNPAEHWFWTAPRHVLNASGGAASKRLLPNGNPRPYMRAMSGSRTPNGRLPGPHMTTYRPRPREIEPTVRLERKNFSLYRALVIHFRGHEFPALNLRTTSTTRFENGAKVVGKQRISLIRCHHRHPTFGRCCNPFCVHSPVPFAALQPPTIDTSGVTAADMRDDILGYTFRHPEPDIPALFTEWEEVGLPPAVIREVLSDPDFRLDTDKPWRDAIKAWLGIQTPVRP